MQILSAPHAGGILTSVLIVAGGGSGGYGTTGGGGGAGGLLEGQIVLSSGITYTVSVGLAAQIKHRLRQVAIVAVIPCLMCIPLMAVRVVVRE